MRTNHRAARASKGIIADGDATDDLCRIGRNPGRRPPVSAIRSLPKGKAGFPAACHVFYFGVFTNSNTASLTGIVIDIGSITDHNITGGA